MRSANATEQEPAHGAAGTERTRTRPKVVRGPSATDATALATAVGDPSAVILIESPVILVESTMSLIESPVILVESTMSLI